MPITSSAKKALKVSRKKYNSNLILKDQLKDAIKKTTDKNINHTVSLIDKAAKKNLIHKNKAARIKSRLAKKIGATPKKEKSVTPQTEKKTKKAKK